MGEKQNRNLRGPGGNMRKYDRIAMVGVLSLGLFLRLWGIGFGLPRVQHADETALIYTAFSMAAEGGRPNVYVHGTVYPSIIAVFSGLYFLWGRLVGWFSDPSVFLVSFIKDPTVIVMFGRSLTVFFALASVWLVYRVGRQLFNARVGLLSSLFLAVSVLHVKESHYVKPDVLLGFVVLLLFLACLFVSQKRELKHSALAGILLGVAVAVKFSALIFFVNVLVVHLLSTNRKGGFSWVQLSRRLVVFLATFLSTFFVVSPYTFLDFRSFAKNVAWFGNTLALLEGKPHSPLWYYLFEYLWEGFGKAIWVLAFLGGVRFLKGKRREGIILLSFPVVFLLSVDFWSKAHVQRYILPIVPLFALLAGWGAEWFFVRLWWLHRRVGALLAVLLLLVLVWQPLMRSLKFDFMITRQQTGELSTAWIKDNVASGSRVAIDGRLRPYFFSGSGPYIFPSGEQLTRELGDLTFRPYYRALKEATRREPGYEILGTPNLGFAYDVTREAWDLSAFPKLSSVDYYLEQGVEYIVMSSWANPQPPHRYAWSDEFRKSLEEQYELIKRFEPSVEFADDPHIVRMDYAALDRVTLFQRPAVFGPTISVYRRKS
ncbi:MAG: hypothetical protein A2900_05975 [Candidatus Chisholmbacteria bacterium RIFCSPLOWO2_01_FULL_50_28]|uniref:Glycosyltransferase RgtA/B/C/D-like domain-containing protein n=1 Tax=Candidatus Chisholmbacteria bacterium RIFCSPHIGHO2_01_FULL_52_32 TaxID=1797591 RepID=A0A1G1VQK9_9BACT|nr:MAG: hypothetical protein A2786_05750 [Candidatus Chisholmbacteria bacterium RIFCSPHIGHO2_01_FULL_52_32]OGY20585.1 MAG: hypothetical protein A2900_05975 [Candidatus Chisholmbacteria bacterium RIFCSPLOWO2_01_FULL_50_28]